MSTEQTTTGGAMSSIDTGRIYVRALLDQQGANQHRAYAEKLVNLYYGDDAEARAIVRAALEAYIDGYEEGVAAGFNQGRDHETRRHNIREEMRHGMTDTFLGKIDALDAATRKELSEIATALHMTLVWSQD